MEMSPQHLAITHPQVEVRAHILNIFFQYASRSCCSSGDSFTNFCLMLMFYLGESETVAKAICLTGGDEAKETAKFIEMVDKLFDCMIVCPPCLGENCN